LVAELYNQWHTLQLVWGWFVGLGSLPRLTPHRLKHVPLAI